MIRQIAIENEGNLWIKTKEECEEFIEALREYERFVKKSESQLYKLTSTKIETIRKKQKLLEHVLEEIADCEVMKKQHEIKFTSFKLNDIIEKEDFVKYQQLFIENIEFINTVIVMKIQRTILRNKVNYYNLEVK